MAVKKRKTITRRKRSTVPKPTAKRRTVKRVQPKRRKRTVSAARKKTPTQTRRRRNTMATRKVTRKPTRKRSTPRRRRSSVNMNVDIQNILINGGIAGAGAFVALFLSGKANSIFDKYTGGSATMRNTLAMGIAVLGSVMGYKYLNKSQATSLANGMVAGIVLLTLKSSFGVNIGLAGDAYSNPLDNYITDAGEGVGLLESPSSLGLLEGRMSDTDFSEYSELNEFME